MSNPATIEPISTPLPDLFTEIRDIGLVWDRVRYLTDAAYHSAVWHATWLIWVTLGHLGRDPYRPTSLGELRRALGYEMSAAGSFSETETHDA